MHIAEERGKVVASLDEEDRYGAVIRDQIPMDKKGSLPPKSTEITKETAVNVESGTKNDAKLDNLVKMVDRVRLLS